MHRHPLSLRIAILLSVVATAVPVIALSFYHARHIGRQQHEEREADTERLAAQVAAGMARYVAGTRLLLVALAHTESVRTLQPAGATRILRELRDSSPLFANLLVADGHGTVIASAEPPSAGPTSIADRAYFRRLQSSRDLGIGEYQTGRITGIPVIIFACPLPDQADTGPLACVIASLDLSQLESVLADASRPLGAGIVLLDRRGTVLAQQGASFAPNSAPFPGWGTAPGDLPRKEAVDLDGRAHHLRFVPVVNADAGLWVGISQPSATVEDDTRRAFLQSLAITSLLALAALLLAWALAHRLVLRPMRRLTTCAARFAGGEWDTRARLHSGASELRQLGNAFDAMAEHLHSQLRQIGNTSRDDPGTASQGPLTHAIAEQHHADAALRRSEATARAFIDSIRETALLLKPDGTILMANQTAATRLHRNLETLVGGNLNDEILAPEIVTQRKTHFETVLRTRRPLVFEDQRQDRLLHTQLTPVLDARGEVAAVAVLSLDITDRRRMEEKLRLTIAELEQALAEVKTLSGLLPICASCKKIRDDKGYWRNVEQYISSHTDAEFSHSLCPDCLRRTYPEVADEIDRPPGGTDLSATAPKADISNKPLPPS